MDSIAREAREQKGERGNEGHCEKYDNKLEEIGEAGTSDLVQPEPGDGTSHEEAQSHRGGEESDHESEDDDRAEMHRCSQSHWHQYECQ